MSGEVQNMEDEEGRRGRRFQIRRCEKLDDLMMSVVERDLDCLLDKPVDSSDLTVSLDQDLHDLKRSSFASDKERKVLSLK